MTSTADGPGGASFGYIHRPVIAERSRQPHMTVLGGEDRFWLGPEGGQYALYFRPGTAFETANWQVPLTNRLGRMAGRRADAIERCRWPSRSR